MPLSPSAPRKLQHLRDIALRGYEREDGLFDIEAELSDRKTYGFPSEDRGWIGPEDRLHGMSLRMTIDEEMMILACEASIDDSPYAICPGAAPHFAGLAGIRIGPGFIKEALKRVGGTSGCTHLRELLQQMGTVAYQTMYPVRTRKAAKAAKPAGERPAPALLDTCHGWSSAGPVIRRGWPHLYTGPDAAPAAPEPEGEAA